VNPAAIGSLIRVFFLAWLTEWVVFVVEVGLIMAYFLLWRRWTPSRKKLHITLGALLSLSSWLTMAIIVAILGFMMDTGSWTESPSLLSGVLNPIYVPQLMFRTPLAMVVAGLFVLFLIPFVTNRESPVRPAAVRWVAGWTLLWAPLCLAGAWWYWLVVPESMMGNLPVAVTTQAFEQWRQTARILIGGAVGATCVVALWGVLWPKRLPRAALAIPFVIAIALLGCFERVREFIRKPYVIQGYMYANGIRVQDYPLLKEQGLLKHAAYVSTRSAAEGDPLEVGRDVFAIACTRCHTTRGVNGVAAKLDALDAKGEWEREQVRAYLTNMHNARPFMPPAPGNDAELEALAAYLCAIREAPAPIEGAQNVGASIPRP
jgi:mono/diheme cytochrome c family protein